MLLVARRSDEITKNRQQFQPAAEPDRDVPAHVPEQPSRWAELLDRDLDQHAPRLVLGIDRGVRDLTELCPAIGPDELDARRARLSGGQPG